MSSIDPNNVEESILLDFVTSIAERLKELNISQAYISRQTGISKGELSRILNLKRRVSIVTANRIASVLNGKVKVVWEE